MFSLPSLRDALYMLVEFVCCLLLALLWGLIQHHRGVEWQRSQQSAIVLKTEVSSKAATSQIVTQYLPKIEYLKSVEQTITKEVPGYVTKEDDSHCTIPNSFVSLWNDANKMQLPSSPSSVDAAPSSVVLSDIAAQHGREASLESQNETKLKALQDWIRQQQAIYNK